MGNIFLILLLIQFGSLSDRKGKKSTKKNVDVGCKKTVSSLSISINTDIKMKTEPHNSNANAKSTIRKNLENLNQNIDIWLRILQDYSGEKNIYYRERQADFLLAKKILTKFLDFKDFINVNLFYAKIDKSVHLWTEEFFIGELFSIRKYATVTNIEEPVFFEKIFEFSKKLISVEKIIYYSFTKTDMILQAERLGLNGINSILNEKKYFFMDDLIVFAFIYKDTFRTKIKDGYILYASFLFEVIKIQLEKIIENTAQSINTSLNHADKYENYYKLEKRLLHVRLLFSKILFVMKDNRYFANIYFSLSLLSFFSILPSQTLMILKTFLFKVLLDLLFSLNFYGGEKFAVISLNPIFDLINELLYLTPSKKYLMQKIQNFLVDYLNRKIIDHSFETLNFLLRQYKNEAIQDYFNKLKDRYNALSNDENASLKEINAENIKDILFKSQICLYSYKIYLPEYSLYLEKNSVPNREKDSIDSLFGVIFLNQLR